MDKGMLRFMAEAYLLLHSGGMVSAELSPKITATAPAKVEERPRQNHGRAVEGKESASQRAEKRELAKDASSHLEREGD
jgi:hypothetical protein